MESKDTKILKFRHNPYESLSGNAIKIIGIILMVMDHLHQMFINQGAPAWLNWFGRPVAAMFLFLCAEGFYFTRSKKQYMLRLLVGFFFMAVFYMWLFTLIKQGIAEKKAGKILLALGGFILSWIAGIALLAALNSGNRPLVMALRFIPNPISAEGGIPLIFLGLLFYILRRYRLIQAALVLITGVLSWFAFHDAQWFMIAAVIPILLYNGQRGRGSKYFFYIFYPVHIYLFYCIAWFIR
jgi:hypothetical protein